MPALISESSSVVIPNPARRRGTSLVGWTTSTRGRTDGGGTPGAATSAAPGRRSRRGSDLLELRVDDVVAGRRGCAAAGMPVTAAVRGRRLGARARVGVAALAHLLYRGLQVGGGALDGVAVAAADRVADRLHLGLDLGAHVGRDLVA